MNSWREWSLLGVSWGGNVYRIHCVKRVADVAERTLLLESEFQELNF